MGSVSLALDHLVLISSYYLAYEIMSFRLSSPVPCLHVYYVQLCHIFVHAPRLGVAFIDL